MFLSILFFSLLFLIKTLLSHFYHRVFLFIPLFSLAVISSVISLPLLLFLFSFFLYLLIYFFFPSSGSLPSFSFILVFFCFLSVKVSRPNIFLKYLNLIAQHPFCLVLFSQTFSRVVPGFLILISQIRRCFFRWSPELELYFFVCLQLLSFLLVHIFTFFSIFFYVIDYIFHLCFLPRIQIILRYLIFVITLLPVTCFWFHHSNHLQFLMQEQRMNYYYFTAYKLTPLRTK